MPSSSESCCTCHDVKKVYTVQEAAEAYDVDADTLRTHIKVGNLVARYPSTRPVIAAEELNEWFNSLAKERE